MIPLSLYIHFPWCIQKCPYCDFNSHTWKDDDLYKNYINALKDDLLPILPRIWGRTVQTIFIGGGTPSLIHPDDLERLFSDLRKLLTISANAEITLEANPGTVDQAYFKAYKDIGINRLSLGIQSLDDNMLKRIGRIHSKNEALKAIDIAQSTGFSSVNCDLMFALPEQTEEMSLSDLQTIINLNPEHISFYQLTLEPNTFFYRYPPKLPSDEIIDNIQLKGQELLRNSGYSHYEVSAFAKKGYESKHNTNYWQFGDYIGIGAGAHGKITDFSSETIIRTLIEKHPRTYTEKTAENRLKIETISPKDIPFEFMLNALRLKSGISRNLFTERTFLPLESIQTTLDQLVSEDLLLINNDRIAPTEKGFLFLNQLLTAFIPDDN